MKFRSAAVAILAGSASTGAAAGPTVSTPDGPVEGFTVGDVDAFRGIPYAAPPTGDNRYRPPQPVSKWTSTLQATDFAPSCLQRGAPGTNTFQPTHPAWATINVTSASEDCLYANVYAPSAARGDTADPVPVMVYFHAGEFRYGAANDGESNWPYFANGKVVLVTANVRLGLFGFAALDELRSRDPTNSTGNYGMQDQRAVLQWVQRNIKAFGGDPTRVTIFGESSGGSSVGFHLSSAASAGLFTGAILESPGLTQSKSWEAATGNTQMAASALTVAKSQGCSWPTNASTDTAWQTLPGVVQSGLKKLGTGASLDEARSACLADADCFVVESATALAKTTYTYYGISGPLKNYEAGFLNYTAFIGPSAASDYSTDIRLSDSETVADCLVNADAGTLVAINLNPPYGDTFSTDAAAPAVDGVELSQPLIHQSVQHPNKDVSVLGGANLDEGTEFMGATPPLKCSASASDFDKWCSLQYPAELAAQIPDAYADLQQPVPKCATPAASTDNYMRAMRSAGESAILCPTRALLQTSSGLGQKNVYWYQFVATPIYSANMGDTAVMGAFHGAEVPFVFGDQFEIKSTGEQNLSAAMGCYWTSFAETGNPNSGDCVKELNLPEWPVIGADGDAMVFGNSSIAATTALKKSRCDMFDKYM